MLKLNIYYSYLKFWLILQNKLKLTIMKKTLLVLTILSCTLISCNKSPEDKAKTLITDLINKRADDPNSYESVEYTNIDSLYSNYIHDTVYIESFEKMKLYKDKAERASGELENYNPSFRLSQSEALSGLKEIKDKTLLFIDSMNYYIANIDSIQDNFKGEFIGWQMGHSFRVKNKAGNKELMNVYFYFDKDITKIDKVVDLDK